MPTILPEEKSVAEFTLRAVLLGCLLAIVMGAANVYLGLYAGMTVSASIPAAVISMGILRGIFRRGTILENNMVQTIASSGESLAAGVIFTIPAFVIAGVWTGFDYWTTTLIALLGGMLGVIMMIPMRRVLIVDSAELKYPEGVACAEVLKAGEAGSTGALRVLTGVVIGGGLKFLSAAVALFRGTVEYAASFSGVPVYLGGDVSVALLGVGAIVGVEIALLVFLGGALGWFIGIPILAYDPAGTSTSTELLDKMGGLWKGQIRYVGVGAMLVGGLWSIVKVRHGIVKGLQELFGSFTASGQAKVPRTEQNLSGVQLLLTFLLIAVPLFFFTVHTVGSYGMGTFAWGLVLVNAFLFVAVASYICGLVGSSNSPVSGMTICALLLTAGLFYLLGLTGTVAILITLTIAGLVCCATCTAGDISQDLKAGYLVGATPRRQQIGEYFGAIVPAFFMAPILTLLHRAYGIGTDGPQSLKAPQAKLFASLTGAIFGEGKLPWTMIGLGIGLAVVLLLLDEFQRRRGASFRFHIMPVAVGIYLPFSLSTPILLGGLAVWLLKRGLAQIGGKKAADGEGKVVLLSSGLIAGEALMGILIAVVIVLNGQMKLLQDIPVPIPGLTEGVSSLLSVTVMLALGYGLYRTGRGK